MPKAINSNVSTDLSKLIIEGIQDRKGKAISIIDLSHIDTSASSGFIICEGTSPTQVSAIADSVREYVQKNSGIKPFNYDGYANSQWIVIDYGQLMVHIFLPIERQRYNLENLWSDAEITEIPDLD